MATVALTPVQLVSDTGVVITQGAGTAIVAANTNTIAYPKDGNLIILIDSDHADTAATLAAGFGIDAQTETYAVGDTIQHMIVVGASTKFKNVSGLLSMTWAANSAGFIRCYYVPSVVA